MALGVNVIIFDAQGRVLLTLREDFEIWCLPGGMMEEGESPAEAALREAREETGLEVRLTRLVGVYTRQKTLHGTAIHFVFAAEAIGGELRPQPSEVLDIGYFAPDALPARLLNATDTRIADAVNGLTGTVQTEYSTPSFSEQTTRRELYALRDASALSKADFYRSVFPPIERIEKYV